VNVLNPMSTMLTLKHAVSTLPDTPLHYNAIRLDSIKLNINSHHTIIYFNAVQCNKLQHDEINSIIIMIIQMDPVLPTHVLLTTTVLKY